MNDHEVNDSDYVERAPRGLLETVVANCRPQPALPAVIVLLFTVMLAVTAYEPGAGRSLAWLLVPVGLIASCGLAIAAGFCSFTPPLAWILFAAWAIKFTANDGPLPAYNRFLFLAGMLAAAIMLCVQLWRVVTGRFVPTVRVATGETRAD